MRKLINPKNKPLFFVVTLVTILFSIYAFTTNNQRISPDDNLLHISFLNIGQGDAIYIRAPNGNDVLIDGGPGKMILSQLPLVMPKNDADLDLVVATHPDADHISGLVPVFEMFTVHYYLFTDKESSSMVFKNLESVVAAEPGLESFPARRGQRFILDNQAGIVLDILYPDQDTSTTSDTNSASIIAKLTYGNESFLFTGDAPSEIEEYLLEHYPNELPSTLLKLGHHGSKYSSSNAFIEAVHPEIGIVSAGSENRYGHPNTETLEHFTTHHIPIISTITEGTITILSNGTTSWKK